MATVHNKRRGNSSTVVDFAMQIRKGEWVRRFRINRIYCLALWSYQVCRDYAICIYDKLPYHRLPREVNSKAEHWLESMWTRIRPFAQVERRSEVRKWHSLIVHRSWLEPDRALLTSAVTAKRKVVTYRKQASRMASFGALRYPW